MAPPRRAARPLLLRSPREHVRGIRCVAADAPRNPSPSSGSRQQVGASGKTALLFWYRDEVYAVEARSPAEGAYSEGFLAARFTQDACIECPSTKTTFDLKTGEIKAWYPDNPVLRALTPIDTCRPMEVCGAAGQGIDSHPDEKCGAPPRKLSIGVFGKSDESGSPLGRIGQTRGRNGQTRGRTGRACPAEGERRTVCAAREPVRNRAARAAGRRHSGRSSAAHGDP